MYQNTFLVIPALPAHGPGQALGIHKPEFTSWVPAAACARVSGYGNDG